MALEIYHNGRKLNNEQLAVYSKLVSEGGLLDVSIAKGLKMFDKALEEQGMPVPPLKVGDQVHWEKKGVKDSGVILEIDARAGKLRVMSDSRKRNFTVSAGHVRVAEDE